MELLQQNWDGAIEQAAAIAKTDPWARRIQAQALFRRGDEEEALEHFKAAAASEPHWVNGNEPHWVNGDGFWSDYGKALVASGRVDEARDVLRELTDRRPGDPAAWHARARFLATTPGLTPTDWLNAVTRAERANELSNRGRAAVLAMLAEAQSRAGDAKAARITAAEVVKQMDGRDALWLSVDEMTSREYE